MRRHNKIPCKSRVNVVLLPRFKILDSILLVGLTLSACFMHPPSNSKPIPNEPRSCLSQIFVESHYHNKYIFHSSPGFQAALKLPRTPPFPPTSLTVIVTDKSAATLTITSTCPPFFTS